MSNYKSLIDEAMKTAQYRLNAGVTKEASISNNDSLIKEASELANALEYMSMDSASDGSLAGQARAEVIRDFHKAATAQRLGVKLAGNVGESTVTATGTQAIAPQSGKTKLTTKVDKYGNPLVTASPDSTGKTMLESYKQASTGTTLYDILMHEKQAGDVGEYDSEQYMSITGANENSNRRILNDSSILSGVSKQEAKAPVRDRLREAFASTSDTLGDATTKSMFPTAYQYGGLKKTAMSPLDEYAMEKEASYKRQQKKNAKKAQDLIDKAEKAKAAEEAKAARAEALKPKIGPPRSQALQRGSQYKNFRPAALIRGEHDMARGTFGTKGSIATGSVRKFKHALKGPQIKEYPTKLTAADRRLIGDPIVHKIKFESDPSNKFKKSNKLKQPSPVANAIQTQRATELLQSKQPAKKSMTMGMLEMGLKQNKKPKYKFTGKAPDSNMRGPMIKSYPTGRPVSPAAASTPTQSSAPVVRKATKEVAEQSKSLGKGAKSLGRGAKAAILGGALVGGMAAKQYVHGRKKNTYGE